MTKFCVPVDGEGGFGAEIFDVPDEDFMNFEQLVAEHKLYVMYFKGNPNGEWCVRTAASDKYHYGNTPLEAAQKRVA